ncbi:DUF6114 domain-containing protein [Streptomyces sp. TRM 70351]|uniref:DUF6114 domain-containing protein n=1 Tax=Streptomyces sp. TRM 70351 TaxID=3116552 RepID=UPI002E7C48B0|nr:DUF6114 domain-containing protein [Streptomyces sp. TRM 70351]MEE1927452.1 DUF6114 domain-containing protein [Streptomyces sp. TRM 70351]
MSAESPGPRDGRFTHLRLRFRAWRRSRPFWAGLLTLWGGLPIAYLPYHDFKLGHLTLTMATTAGAGSLIIGVLLVTLGLTMWYQQLVRVFAGIASILLALVSIPVANLGGFGLGFLPALIGGALAVSWTPGTERAAGSGHHGDPGPDPDPGTRPDEGDTAPLPAPGDEWTGGPAVADPNGGTHRAG